MPSVQTLAMGFIGLNSFLACWKPIVESNSTNPAPICSTSLCVLTQTGWRTIAIPHSGLDARCISFAPVS
jgi:hypothetical protein